jgi:lipid-binding SYLF domain-containing protein
MSKSMRALQVAAIAGMLCSPVILGARTDEGYKSGQATKHDKKEAKAAAKINEAEQVLKASVSAPDQGIPKDLLEKAECVGVFPGFKKVALGVGGEGGKGIFTCRTGHGMSPPAFFKIGGGSIGWQAGIEEADLVLLVMNEEGMNKLLTDKVKIGADISAAAGPVGRKAEASTDAMMNAQILSWSRSRGAFAGASLEGLVLTQDEDDNEMLYDKPVEAREILSADTDSLPVPQIAKSFIKTTEQYTD